MLRKVSIPPLREHLLRQMKVTKAKALSTRHSCVATRVRPVSAMLWTSRTHAAISSPHASLRIGVDRESCEATTVLLLGPLGASRSTGVWGRVRKHASSTDFARLSERIGRRPRSEFCARSQTPSTAEQSALGRPPPSGRLFFGDFLLAKQKKVTALSGAHPDSASRSEQPPRQGGAGLRYLSLSGLWCGPSGRWCAKTQLIDTPECP